LSFKPIFLPLNSPATPTPYISAMAKLTDQNLAEGEPPRWVETLLDDHPSYRQRVAMAQRFKTSR